MAAMLTLVGVSDEVEERADEAPSEIEQDAVVVWSRDDRRPTLSLSVNEPQVA